MTSPDRSPSAHPLQRWLSTTPCLLLLIVVILQWAGSASESQFKRFGDWIWDGEYISTLREAPVYPEKPSEAPKIEIPKADEELIDDILSEDELGDLLDENSEAKPEQKQATPPPVVDPQIEAQRRYEEKVAEYERIVAMRTPSVILFSSIDLGIRSFANWVLGHFEHLFVLLLGICGITATAHREHIALRTPQGPTQDRISQSFQLLANVLLALSSYSNWQLQAGAGIGDTDSTLYILWILAFSGMATTNVWHLIRPLPRAASNDSAISRGLLGVPLYTTMALISCAYFVLKEDYLAGCSVYLGKLSEHAELYLQVGLYVWAGMLLKRSQLATRSFDVLRPWQMPPELLALIIIAFSAIPTAYSGASGIFVIATGDIIFREMRRAKARRQLSMATTAMSGSLGVVLQPCLLVVIVANLNSNYVDSAEQLFHWGSWVYLLTVGLFALIVFITRRNPLKLAPPRVAGKASLLQLKPLVPYATIFVTLLIVYWLILDVRLDQFSAAQILPVILMFILLMERRTGSVVQSCSATVKVTADATREATSHIGALLTLMGLSVCLGGIVERSNLTAMVPEQFASVWLTMALFVVVLIVIGMLMDPYGAAILVSATIATIAYRNGIHPVHFWMVVLVAFELGYLTPPVALNQLLAKQVVGEDADSPPHETEGQSFWVRHERYLLPIVVVATCLLIVAFGPLLLGISAAG